ncbi:MAG: 1,4-alpha-glucan branching protein GlgB [Acidobacteriota bacterium]|nr:1,4-alpha-glucan branching protein GlgB [Acidobacteriota bacterium]
MSDTLVTDDDLRRMTEGHARVYELLGAHLVQADRARGVRFGVVAPGADAVSVVGDFNGWETAAHPMGRVGSSGVWQRWVPGVEPGALYKYRIQSGGRDAVVVDKADPLAFAAEVRPRTASRVWDLSSYRWHDASWQEERGNRQTPSAPISIYEVHLGSWRRDVSDGSWLSYRQLASELAEYLVTMEFTHVELLPVAEHPLDASWGYQVTGYYAPTSRFGTPDDFRYLVDTLHQAGIGVILDWVPGHFPDDPHGLAMFDGSALYEYADPRQGRHPEWNTQIFDLGRPVVRDFLVSNACFWFDKYHIDGLRVDAVASMLYLDYARGDGEWVPNAQGGRENLDAADFLRGLNDTVCRDFPDVLMFAEESTAWPGVSRRTDDGGLGFGYKWNMGWMNDMLAFMSEEPGRRGDRLGELTFSLTYAFAERFLLPLSHDEVVHGKRPIVDKMPGDDGQRFANARLLYGYMYGHPGKKLLFMGNELGPRREWDHDGVVDWSLAEMAGHDGLQRWVRDLNRLYRSDARLHAADSEPGGFAWVDHADRTCVVLSFLRTDRSGLAPLLFVCNFSDTAHHDYRIGVPEPGRWTECLNSDAMCYGGSGVGNPVAVQVESRPWQGQPRSCRLTLPPLSVLVMTPTTEPVS